MDSQTDIWIDIVRALGSGGITAIAVSVGYLVGLIIVWIVEG